MHRKQISRWPITVIMLFPLVLLVLGLGVCYHKGGFNVSKIRSNLPFNDYWEVDPLSYSQRELLVHQVFPQTYYYLSAGKHCYTFVSEDERYVIKFFKKDAWSPKGWLQQHPLPFLRYLGYQIQSDSPYLSEHLFTSYKNAYESFRYETGLLYLHLNKHRDFKIAMTLVDLKGRRHKVDLDHVEFVVQKWGEHLFDRLNTLAKAHDEKGFRSALSSFLRLIAVRCEKGFASQNVVLHNHFGFVGDSAIQFDCGMLSQDLSMKYPLNIRKEILLAVDKVDLWVKERYPHLSIAVQEEAEQLLNQIL